MDKEKLIAMGLTEEQTEKVLTEEQVKKILASLGENFVEKTKFDEVSKENMALKETISERDKQLGELKKSSGDNEELKKQIEALEAQNKEEKAAHEKAMAQLKLDNAVETALTAAGVKNNKALKALLDSEKIKLDENGKLSGLSEQLEAVKKSDPYMFNEQQSTQPSFKGFQPGASSDDKPGAVDFSNMTYSQQLAYMEQNPSAKF